MNPGDHRANIEESAGFSRLMVGSICNHEGREVNHEEHEDPKRIFVNFVRSFVSFVVSGIWDY